MLILYNVHDYRCELQWTEGYFNQQDPQQQDRAGAQDHRGVMFSVTVWAMRPVTVIGEAAFQLSTAHGRLVTEGLESAWLQNGVCGGKNTHELGKGKMKSNPSPQHRRYTQKKNMLD